MKTTLTFIALLLFYYGSAQKIEQYFDWRWNPTEPASARYYGVMEKNDSVWNRKDYYIHERSLQMEGSYKDTACKIAHGHFVFFHPNRSVLQTGNYINNKKEGLWLSFHNNGLLSDSAFYHDGQVIGTRMGWHSNGYISDSSVWNVDGSGVQVRWFDNGNPSSAGKFFSESKQHGKWQYFHKNGNLSATEIFDRGRLISRQYFDETGTPITDTASRDNEFIFPGGQQKWAKYLYKQLFFPSQFQIVNTDKDVVVVEWTIDEEGNVTDINVYTPFYPEFDKIAVAAIKKSRKWIPAIDHNRRVKSYKRQPVIFAQ